MRKNQDITILITEKKVRTEIITLGRVKKRGTSEIDYQWLKQLIKFLDYRTMWLKEVKRYGWSK